MSVPDPNIRALYARLEEVLGAEHADTLMTRLPPPPDELAKQAEMVLRFDDVNLQFKAVGVRFDGLERRFERLEDRLDHIDESMHHMFEMMLKQQKSSTTMMVTAMTALTAIYGGMLVAFAA